jgi:proline iminopeptidase
MKNILALLLLIILFGCQNQDNKNTQTNENTARVQEKTFVELGGEKQYVEMTGSV